jgi:hypothetical protein
MTALVGAARDANRTATLDFGKLTYHRAHGPGRSRYDHGVARLRLTSFEQPKIRSHSRHTQHVEESWKRRHTRVGLDQAFAF